MRSGRRQTVQFVDTFAIYYSPEDRYWVAHSLRTDQFGTGDCVVNALVDGLKAVQQVIALAERKSGIEIFRPAPDEIVQIARRAKRLPDELYRIARRRFCGTWEDDLDVTAKPIENQVSFTRKVREEMVACS